MRTGIFDEKYRTLEINDVTGEKRREEIMKVLDASDKPMSATALAKMYGVSRQIIVGDIALLRAEAKDIIATNKGYIINKIPGKAECMVKVRHKPEDLYDELCSIVDLGAQVLTEEIESPVYGRIVTEIHVLRREDARVISEKFMDSTATQLSELTKGVHYHKIVADNELTIIRVQKTLNEKHYLTK